MQTRDLPVVMGQISRAKSNYRSFGNICDYVYIVHRGNEVCLPRIRGVMVRFGVASVVQLQIQVDTSSHEAKSVNLNIEICLK